MIARSKGANVYMRNYALAILLFASHANAAPITFVYSTTVDSSDLSGVAVDDLMVITFTFSSEAFPLSERPGVKTYPLIKAAVTAGSLNWQFTPINSPFVLEDLSLTVENDATDSAGVFRDAYTFRAFQAERAGNEIGVTLLTRSTDVPPSVITSTTLPLQQPDPTTFAESGAFLTQYGRVNPISFTAAGTPVLISPTAIPESNTWFHVTLGCALGTCRSLLQKMRRRKIYFKLLKARQSV
jgi:hypothetical protein